MEKCIAEARGNDTEQSALDTASQAVRFYLLQQQLLDIGATAEQLAVAYPGEEWDYTILDASTGHGRTWALCFADSSISMMASWGYPDIAYASPKAYLDSLDEGAEFQASSLAAQIMGHYGLDAYELEEQEAEDDWEPYSWLYITLPGARRAVPKTGIYRIVSTCGQETVEVWIDGERYWESNLGLQPVEGA